MSHVDGIYRSDYRIRDDDLFCYQCGDCDEYLGEFGLAIEFLEYFEGEISYNGSGGYDLKTLLEDLIFFDDCPSFEKAEEIIRNLRTKEK